MNIAFFLSMPSCPSWDGRWSGEGRKYVLVKKYTTTKGIADAQQMVEKGSYWYSWSDGWGAEVSVKEVDAKEARALKKESQGFSGYDWMVDSICSYGKIMNDCEREDYLAKKATSCNAEGL